MSIFVNFVKFCSTLKLLQFFFNVFPKKQIRGILRILIGFNEKNLLES
jgi:hypothetical protein